MSSLLAHMATLDEEYEYGYFVEKVWQWIFADCRFSSTPMNGCGCCLRASLFCSKFCVLWYGSGTKLHFTVISHRLSKPHCHSPR